MCFPKTIQLIFSSKYSYCGLQSVALGYVAQVRPGFNPSSMGDRWAWATFLFCRCVAGGFNLHFFEYWELKMKHEMPIDVKIINKIIFYTVAQNIFSYSIHIYHWESFGNYGQLGIDLQHCMWSNIPMNSHESTGYWSMGWKNTSEDGLGWVSTGLRIHWVALAIHEIKAFRNNLFVCERFTVLPTASQLLNQVYLS